MRKTLFILSICLMALVSCSRKELLEPGHHHGSEIKIRINEAVDREENPDVYFDSEYYGNLIGRSNSLTVVAYPKDLNGTYQVHRLDAISGSIWLLPGEYDLLIYTSDFNELDGVFYRGMESQMTAEAYTNQAKAKDTKETKDAIDSESKTESKSEVKSIQMDTPDPLFSRLFMNFKVSKRDTTLTANLHPQSYRYWFEVDVEGLEYISAAYLEIAGMYTTVFMADGSHREDEYGRQQILTTIHPTENKIKGEFFSFGPHQREDVDHSMLITFINGRTIRVNLDDSTPAIKKLTRGGEIVIEQKIVINVDDTGAGFVPDVEDWEDIEIEIPI